MAPENKVTIGINFTEEAYQEFKKNVQAAGKDTEGYIKDAIRTYCALLGEKGAAKRVYIGDENKIEKELLIP